MAVILIKVSANLTTKKSDDGGIEPDVEAINAIGTQAVELHQENNVGIIYSGAIALGMFKKGLKKRPSKSEMSRLQWLACVGNPVLVGLWEKALSPITTGQLLLTKNELNHNIDEPERRYEREEALGTLEAAFEEGDIWLANENDAIAHDEITFGDNDILAAIIAAEIKRSRRFSQDVKLIVLSDVDGVYKNFDDENRRAIISTIEDIEAYGHVIVPSESEVSTGGMKSKFEAAKIATASGVDMWVANGRTPDVIKRAMAGEVGTHFVAKQPTKI